MKFSHPQSCPSNVSSIEPLEARIAPAGIIAVTTFSDKTSGSTHNSGSLRDAIYLADATPGSTIEFLNVHGKPIHGVITISSSLGPLPAITSDVTIAGKGVTINANGTQGLSITGDTTGITVSGLTITGGKAPLNNGTLGSGGDLSITGGTNIELSGVKLTNGTASTGGGLYINTASADTVTITGSIITGNHAIGAKGTGSAGYNAQGGGIAIVSGTVTIENKSQVTHNTAIGGAGDKGGYNGGLAAGAGVFNEGTLTVTQSTISGNTATGGNGGASINYAYSASLGATPATAGGSGGNAYGGGIANSGGTLTLTKSVMSGNAAHGGTGQNGGANYVGNNGKAFYVANGAGYGATYGTVGGNGNNGGNGGNGVGGGIGSTGSGSVTLTKSTLSGNSVISGKGGNGAAGSKGGNGGAGGQYAGTTYYAAAGGYGGNGGNGGNGGLAGGAGVYATGTLKVISSTISGNLVTAGKAGTLGAAGKGGTGYGTPVDGTAGYAGIYYGSRGGGVDSESGSLFMVISTIAKNTAANGGGVSVIADTSAVIHNTTIAENVSHLTGGTGGLFITLDSGSDPVNVVSSLIAGNTGTNVTGTLGSGSSNNLTSTVSPLLGSLGFHGGGTTLTTGATQTLIPSHLSGAVVGTPGLNPDTVNYGFDQNGHLDTASAVNIGSVFTST